MTNVLASWLLEQITKDERRALAVCSYSRETTAREGGDNWTVRRSQVRPEDTIEVWATVGSQRPHFTGITLPVSTNLPGYLEEFDPARVLAECDAKRRILARHAPRVAAQGPHEGQPICGCSPGQDEFLSVEWPCADVRDLASIYADHPGYPEEWKP